MATPTYEVKALEGENWNFYKIHTYSKQAYIEAFLETANNSVIHEIGKSTNFISCIGYKKDKAQIYINAEPYIVIRFCSADDTTKS